MDYEIQVKTAKDFAGTEVSIMVSLFGAKGDLLDIPLKQSETNLKPFEKDKLDRFFFDKMKNIGELKQIKVKVESTGKQGTVWKVDFIKVFYDNSAYM